MARKRRARKPKQAEDIVTTESIKRTKQALAVFDTDVEPEKDYISSMPPEVIDNILSYCALDHEPELAKRKSVEGSNYVERPHVITSLAAMSKLFHDCVESFCQRQLMLAKERHDFKTLADLDIAAAIRRAEYFAKWRPQVQEQKQEPPRRSPRLEAQPQQEKMTVHRKEFLRWLRQRCCVCDKRWYGFKTMLTGANMCHTCEYNQFGSTMCLTTALQQYDLRDYMLIATRQPGPRAKHINLPTITYGTTKGGTGMILGSCVSYRFYTRDVKRIAALVHGDVDAHMQKKRHDRHERRARKFRKSALELKIRYHTDCSKTKGKKRTHHRERAKHYQALQKDDDYDSDELSDYEFGDYGDVHQRLCQKGDACRQCYRRKVSKYYDKYSMQWMYQDAYYGDEDDDSEYFYY